MMETQGASTDAQFMALKERIVCLCDLCVKLLRSEPNGTINEREKHNIMRSIEIFKTNTFIGREFQAHEPLSMIICLIVDQLALIHNECKRVAFAKLLEETENLMTWADPEWVEDGREGYQAAVIFNEVEI